MTSRSILVVGIHRSGTSAIAGILHHLGVNMGKPPEGIEPDFWYAGWPAYDSNPRAQFEDGELCAINRKLIGPDWRTPPPVGMLRNQGFAGAMELAAKLEEIPLSGLKDPALCFTAGVFIKELRRSGVDVGIIFVHRDFDAIVDSLLEREPIPRPVMAYIAAQYFVAMNNVRGLFPEIPQLDVTFPYLFQDTAGAAKKIAKWAFKDREPPTPEQIAAAVDHIDHGLNHHG